MLQDHDPLTKIMGEIMNVFKIAAVGAALLMALPAAAATTINFDQLPNGSTLPNSGTTIDTQYQSLGVTFSGTNTIGGYTGALNSWGIIPASGPGGSGNYLASFGAIPAGGVNNYLIAPRYDIMSVVFANTASAISFGLSASSPGVTINAYNSAGGLLQSLTGVASSSGFAIQTLTATGVARVDIVGTFSSTFANSARIFGIDNLTFTPAATAGAVPEPATWAMMIVGFGLVGGAMRRRQAKIAFA